MWKVKIYLVLIFSTILSSNKVLSAPPSHRPPTPHQNKTSVTVHAPNTPWAVICDDSFVSEKLQPLLKSKKNKKLEVKSLKSLILKELKDLGYLTTRVNFSEESRTITIENTKKYLIAFKNNIFINKRTLKKSLDLENLMSTDESIEDDITLRVKSAYKSHGFSNVQVTVNKTYYENEKLTRLVYKIREGETYSIGQIKINGQFSQKPSYYINLLNKNSAYIFKKRKFSKLDFENSLRNLITYLKNKGFLEASYSGLRVKRAKGKKNIMNISFDLYEGLPTKIQSIQFIGNTRIPSEQLKIIFGLKKEDILDFYKLEEGVLALNKHYLSMGFLGTTINTGNKEVVILNSEKRQALLDIYIQESNKIIAGEIKINGLQITKKYVVKNMLDFKIGDVITIEKINKSKRRLNSSGLFGQVAIQFSKENLSSGGHLVTIDLEERKPGVFQMGIGARFNQNAFSLKGYSGFLYKNLKGTARAINSRLELQTRLNDVIYPEHKAFVSYFEPFLFDKDIRGQISLESSENIFEIVRNKKSGVASITLFGSLGIQFILENNFNKHIRTSWTLLGFKFNREFFINDYTPEIRERIGFFGPRLFFDYRNNPFLPTDGSFTLIQSEYASPYLGTQVIARGVATDIEYIRSEFNYTRYDPLDPRLIWVNTLKGGWLKNLSLDTHRFPKSRAFFLGGTTTIRGFDPSDGENERIPSNEDIITNSEGVLGGVLLNIPDDSFYYLLKTEFRFPVYKNIWGSLFYDGGSVLIDGFELKDNYRHSAGIGIRYNTPIGAFTGEVGIKLDRDKSRGEQLTRFHLNIGTF